MQTTKITATTTGANGSAAGENISESPLSGFIVGVYVDYTSQPATADVTITFPYAPTKTVLTLTNNATDGWYYPKVLAHDEAGVALTERIYIPIDGYIKAAVAQGNAGSVDVYILWIEG
jgi:hypothetical protein